MVETILVAGAAGFIGFHVIALYLSKGHRVIGLDNFITGSKSNIAQHLLHYKNFTFYECDICDALPRELDELFHIDYILSLASPASPRFFSTNAVEIARVNSIGVDNLLQLALRHHATFLQASTSEVYGSPDVSPQSEAYVGRLSSMGPRSCYDISKLFSETLTIAYHRQYGLDTRIVRIFNTYGPNMQPDDNRVISNFITQALNNESLTIYGDGSQTRSYCYVSDTVQAINSVLKGFDVTPINIGNPDEHSITETAEIILKVLDSKSSLVHLPLPQDDPIRRCPDISKVQAMCDFVPKVPFEEGIRKTATYFQSLNKQ